MSTPIVEDVRNGLPQVIRDESPLDLKDLRKAIENGDRLTDDQISRLSPKQAKTVVHLLTQRALICTKELERKKRQIDSLEAFEAWERLPPALGRNEITRAHQLIEEVRDGGVVWFNSEGKYTLEFQNKAAAGMTSILSMAHAFVVKHDWLAALGASIDAPNEVVALPYPQCMFEFVVNGRPVIVYAAQSPGESPLYSSFAQFGESWFAIKNATADELKCGKVGSFVWHQIVAVCVSLDAEVAVTTTIRADAALNKARERNGKPRIRSYHVVDLSRRARYEGGPGGHDGAKRRLHFRRGHWRHYESFKTWVRWTLVGDPSLGFVDKHYSL